MQVKKPLAFFSALSGVIVVYETLHATYEIFYVNKVSEWLLLGFRALQILNKTTVGSCFAERS